MELHKEAVANTQPDAFPLVVSPLVAPPGRPSVGRLFIGRGVLRSIAAIPSADHSRHACLSIRNNVGGMRVPD